jgi:Branched-chain amino acid transport protein (AzlD).
VTMPVLVMILLMSAVTMGSRIAGFFAVNEPKGKVGRALHYLPFGLFGAIVVTGLPKSPDVSRLAVAGALLVTGVGAWRKWPIILSLAAGFAAYVFISLT